MKIARRSQLSENPIPRPVPREKLICDTSKPYSSDDACYPLDVSNGQPWSLTEVFGRSIKGRCLSTDAEDVAPDSVCIEVPHNRDVYTSPGATEHKHQDENSRCFTLPDSSDFEMLLPEQGSNIHNSLKQPLLHAERSFTGHGQERGGVQTLLTNPSPTSPVEFIYLESLPWFMKPYLHTLKAQIAGQISQPSDIIKDIYYRPALDRQRGTQLEIRMTVPPASIVTLAYDFEKAILRYTEYPPDANRGFDVAPAVIRLTSNTTSGPVYLRTTSLLLPLPTPDFSMPYNVIILTSTVMALAFGNIFNLLVRRFVGADEVEGYDVGRIKARIRGRLAMLRDKFVRREKKTQ